jgi:hypothetical protein
MPKVGARSVHVAGYTRKGKGGKRVTVKGHSRKKPS